VRVSPFVRPTLRRFSHPRGLLGTPASSRLQSPPRSFSQARCSARPHQADVGSRPRRDARDGRVARDFQLSALRGHRSTRARYRKGQRMAIPDAACRKLILSESAKSPRCRQRGEHRAWKLARDFLKATRVIWSSIFRESNQRSDLVNILAGFWLIKKRNDGILFSR